MALCDLLYEDDPILAHRWIEKVDFGEADFWNLTVERYFGTTVFVKPKPLEDQLH